MLQTYLFCLLTSSYKIYKSLKMTNGKIFFPTLWSTVLIRYCQYYVINTRKNVSVNYLSYLVMLFSEFHKPHHDIKANQTFCRLEVIMINIQVSLHHSILKNVLTL